VKYINSVRPWEEIEVIEMKKFRQIISELVERESNPNKEKKQ
jgi:hypothetical protein